MLDLLSGGLSTPALIALAATAFVAALARGFSGFGAALIFVPLASAVIGPKAAAAILLITDGVLTLGFIPQAWRRSDRKEVWTMTLGALAGVPLGAWILAVTDPLIIRWAIVAIASLMLALLMSGWRYHGRPVPPVTVAVGVIAGLFSGAAQAGGPPIVAYWVGGPSAPATVRANIILYSTISTAIAVVSYFAGGLFTKLVLSLSLVVGPSYGLGLYLGSHMFGFASETTFRRICYALIAAAVILGLPVLDGLFR